MPNTRAQFQRLLFPGLRELVWQAYTEKPQQFATLCKVMPSSSAFEEDMSAAGVGLFSKTAELQTAPADQFVPGFYKRYQHDDFKLRIGFSEQAIRDMKVQLANDRGTDLGFSGRQTKEVLVADIWNNGFTTIQYDGVPLFAPNHPNIRGAGIQSNLLGGATPTPATLSIVALRQALSQYRRFFDMTGVRRIQVNPVWLVVPPEEEWNAYEILKSAGRPDTANRADNVTRNILTPFVYDYLLHPQYWFIGPEAKYNRIKVYNRVDFRVKTYEDDDSDTNWVQAMFAFSFGVTDWMGWLGTNPGP